MSCVVIATAGTYGDLIPYLILGQALHAQGHQVRFAAAPSCADLVRRAGLGFHPCRPDINPALARRRYADWDHWSGRPVDFDPNNIDLPAYFSDCCQACAGADLLLCAPGQLAGELVHEYTAIPWLSLTVTPALFSGCSRDDASHRAMQQLLADRLNGFRRHLRLAPLPPTAYANARMASHIILGASRHFCRPAATFADAITQTGFWFGQSPSEQAWQPDPELEAFLSNDPPPLLLTFSSQPVADQAAVVARYAAAASALQYPLLIQAGWTGLGNHLAPGLLAAGTVMLAGHIPHDYLFPRVAAVMHHGGIGTTARALRHGRSMLVEPYGNDQFHNAMRIVQLGVGAAIHPHRATVASLAWLLREKVLTGTCRARAVALGAALAAENGVRDACQMINARL